MSTLDTDTKAQATDPKDGLSALEGRGSIAETFGIPLAVLAEVTHRCPLQCPYCSNPVELDRGGTELSTEEWKKVLTELAEIGVLQIHFSGGEPTARKDLVELVRHTREHPSLLWGASPRASVGLLLASKALAAMRDREFATPDDVRDVVHPALRHRILLRSEAEIEGITPDLVLDEILASVEVPR